MELTTLEGRIKSTVNFVERKSFTSTLTKCKYIFDGLYRYIIQYPEREPLVKVLGQFGLDDDCVSRYKELVNGYGLSYIDENCKLKLREAIYLEKKFEKKNTL